ncbi:MAG: hypothetical protein IVW36_02340 [Dehalococcoidia bacterium]|nr:hypothetical protein [Dehalococcoidia bacterium]
MTLAFRRIAIDDEWRARSRIADYAFNGRMHDAAAIARRERWYERDWCRGVFDAAEVVGGLVVMPVPGRRASPPWRPRCCAPRDLGAARAPAQGGG